ncbi:MAG: hypothetical protein EBT15_11435 [Betaproteobacteria bacterium]|jgi:hypothetical protein|nr:hypothetical protein [Betaproteobacteria bacterium]
MQILKNAARCSMDRILTAAHRTSPRGDGVKLLDETYKAILQLNKCARVEKSDVERSLDFYRVNTILDVIRRLLSPHYVEPTLKRSRRMLLALLKFGGAFSEDAKFTIDCMERKGLFWLMKNPELIDPLNQLKAILQEAESA